MLNTVQSLARRTLPASRAFASFAKFDFKDPLNFEGLLTDEEKMIEESARQYAQEKLLPRVTEAY